MSLIFSNAPAERAILAGLCQYNGDAYFDIVDIVNPSTFTDDTNCSIYRCIKHILDNDDQAQLDIPLLLGAAEETGIAHMIKGSTELKYMQSLFQFPINMTSVRKFAGKIRRLEIAKLLEQKLVEAQGKLLEIKGDESMQAIIHLAEEPIFDFINSVCENEAAPSRLGEGATEYLQYLMDNPVDQMGISTGYPAYDQFIGGGLRPATLNVIAARPKSGKTMLTDNMGYHIAGKLGIPVLNMDTEMTKEDHIHRTTALMAGVPINDIETGQVGKKADWKAKVIKASDELATIPYVYKSICGMAFEEQIGIMRRWLMQDVGLNSDGTAKPCVILYDYLKLMDTQGISSDMKEYQLLGFMMTTLHNFAARYKIPFVVMMQQNRDGETKATTATASGSDRIIWLCSNFSILTFKTDDELAQDGVDAGNRKIIPVVARHGNAADPGDYISYTMKGFCSQFIEGKTKFELDASKKTKDEGFEIDDSAGNTPVAFGD